MLIKKEQTTKEYYEVHLNDRTTKESLIKDLSGLPKGIHFYFMADTALYDGSHVKYLRFE